MFDQGAQNVGSMADEIDGDDRLGLTRRTGLLFNSKLVSVAAEPTYNINDSMFIEAAMSYEELYSKEQQLDESLGVGRNAQERDTTRHRRYSIIGNDPTFKQYTKNHDYDVIKYSE